MNMVSKPHHYIAATLAVMYSVPAFAAPEHDETLVEAAHDDKPAGLPQLDPEYFASQIFWLAVTFVILYVIFARNILPALSGIIETRRTHIQSDLDEAEKLRDQAEKVHTAYEKMLADAHHQTSDLMLGVETEIKEKTAKSADDFRNRSTKEIQKMQETIDTAKAKAMDDMTSIAAEIASQAAEKIVGISTDVDQAKTVVKNINKKAA